MKRTRDFRADSWTGFHRFGLESAHRMGPFPRGFFKNGPIGPILCGEERPDVVSTLASQPRNDAFRTGLQKRVRRVRC